MFVLFACFLFTSFGHNWMVKPASRNGNTDSTAKPCPSGTTPSQANVRVALDYPFEVEWTTNHNGDHFVKVAALSAESEIENMVTVNSEENPTELYYYQTFANDVPSATVTISDVLPGSYLLQYGWSGYRNCATIQVVSASDPLANTPLGLEGADEIVSAEANVDCNTLCRDFDQFCSDITVEHPYIDMDDCLMKCSSFPLGLPGDAVGNSLHCRWHHLHVEGGDPAIHCPHASYNNSVCMPGDYLPSITIQVSSTANTADEIQTEITTVLASQGYDDVMVTVVESDSTSSFLVITQFATFDDADALLVEGVFTGALEESDLALDTVNVLGETAPVNMGPGAGAINSNIIAAAVSLPLALVAVFGLAYFFRANLTACLPMADADTAALRKASVGQHLLTFVVLCICLASGYWAADDLQDTTFGLFSFCASAVCASMASWDPSAAGAVQAAQAFAVLALLCAVACVLMHVLAELKGFQTGKFAFLTTMIQSVLYFFAICLYSAYFYDILSANTRLGWAADLFGVWWLVVLFGVFLDYRVFTSTSGALPTPKSVPQKESVQASTTADNV